MALVAPVLILLVLVTIDFGRLFLEWVSLNNTARVAANYAAAHPNAWPTNAEQQAEYAALIGASNPSNACVLADATPPPTFLGSTKDPGELVRVDLTCDFPIITPLISILVGDDVTVSASSTFPITGGCIANCGGTGAPPPPVGVVVSACRAVPDLTGLSVLGAERLWVASGFSSGTLSPSDEPTRTVSSQTVTEPTGAPPCPAGEAFFGSSVTVDLEPIATVVPPCVTVPNLVGMSVAEGRDAWVAAPFTGAFSPPLGSDARVITSQTTNPSSDPGDCLEDDPTSVSVTHAAPPPAPPAAPCKVPSLVNTHTSTAVDAWTDAGFEANKLFFQQNPPYEIKGQTLIGNQYYSCASSMTVGRTGNVQPAR